MFSQNLKLLDDVAVYTAALNQPLVVYHEDMSVYGQLYEKILQL